MKKSLVLLAVFVVGLLLLVQTVNAQSAPPGCHWDFFQHKVVCKDSGGNNGVGGTPGPGNNGVGGTPGPGNNGGSDNSTTPACNGILTTREVLDSIPHQGFCWYKVWLADGCGNLISFNGVFHIALNVDPVNGVCGTPAPLPVLPPPSNPCNVSSSWTGSGFSASCNSGWECTTAVPLPPTYIDVRPYPVTLVRWPTAIRSSGQGTSNDSCLVSDAGQMRNLRLSLEFRPATGVVTVTLPYLPTFTFNASSFTAQPVLFKWEVPSNPAVGADRLSGTLGGFFDEIPADFPVFSGQMKTPYRLYWTVSFERNEYGNWVGYSFNGELLPQDVRDLPSSMIADLNGDGTGDAYWDSNFIISRMDENNRTDNPLYERHFSYGSLLPWAVREGQAQIGWPGVP